MGKLFVVFEELPTFSKEQWKGVSSKLKTLTTEKMSIFRDLFEKPFQASNLLNFQINTNVEALKDSQGRRIMIMDINFFLVIFENNVLILKSARRFILI